MLITLCYLYLWVRFQRCYPAVIRGAVGRFHGSGSVTFTRLRPGPGPGSRLPPRPRPRPRARAQSPPPPPPVYLSVGDRALVLGAQQLYDDLSRWSPFLQPPASRRGPQVVFVIEATSQKDDSRSVPRSEKVLKYSDLCVPLARSPGNPYMLMAEASVEDFSNLGIAFMENRLEMDDGMVPAKIVSVQLKGPLGNEPSKPSERGRNEPARGSCPSRTSVSEPAPGGEGEAGGETGEERGRESHRPQEEERFESHAHGLHLASCSECLGLESSTIESVRCASAENPPSAGPERGEEGPAGAGQRRSEGGGRRAPPNVLVYLGPDGEDDGGRGNAAKFRRVQSLLTDLIDSERYVIYRLLEEHVATEPWPENSLLLVVACERPPAPRAHARFMSYLSRGGKVLGLCSGFTFGGARLSARGRPEERVLGLRFTGSQGGPSLSLHALASRRVFSLDRATAGAEAGGDDDDSGGAQPWASLENPRRDPVVVRLPHGDNGGEAVLCQVHLETAPDGEEIQAQEDFQTLKLSNALRYQVLREILTFLQLSCECTETPKLTPANLLISCKDIKLLFLKWLRDRLDVQHVLRSEKVSLKVTETQELGMEVTPSLLPVLTDTQGFRSEGFDPQVYWENLGTRLLGRVVLFTEVVATTMDLFGGWMLQLPEEVGLIAIAARQTQGKGRGRNAWISPKGSAMFTAHVCIPLHSELGRCIPFIQHLVPLAVVEAVLSLPGYEDIDLRVKWPNDIYYSGLMKLGGALVTSTLMGTTFHVLIGCGFNVSNSNPTICINDIIQRHNRENGTDLQPFRIDQLIARTLTQFEDFLHTFQTQGPNGVLPLYYKRWLHSGRQVRLWREDGPVAHIVGLDNCGFLQVQQEDDVIISVQPDGNSFDMLRNLIVTKQR